MLKRTISILSLLVMTAFTGVCAADVIDDQPLMTANRASQATQDDYVYRYKGVKYTYITKYNYTRYFNTSIHTPEDYGYTLNSYGWYVDGPDTYITAASIDADDFPESGEVYIINDLVGFGTSHTHLACIADNAFRYMPGVRSIYFQDCDGIKHKANTYWNFFIGDCAFADCENLQDINMIQWVTTGDNRFEGMPPTVVKRIWGSMLNNSPNARIFVGNELLQQYLESETWKQVRDRISGRSVKAPKEDYVKTYKGVKYTYITESNYTRYFNLNIHKPEDYGYTLVDGWYMSGPDEYITAASIDADDFPENGEVYILNDLVGFGTSHTHLACIADNAFRYMSGVRRVFFQDCDAVKHPATSFFNFFIGDCAFADCENLEEINMMQWTTSGDNHWETLPPTAVNRIWGSMLNNSPKAWIRVGKDLYQQYLGSQTWVQVRDRITTYEHASDDITLNGAVYSYMRNENHEPYSNANEEHEEIMKTLRLWNSDYLNFNAATLLSDKSSTKDNANIWYTTINGADADYLKKNDGVLRIYNDPGSYYNYKTIAISKGAFAYCDELREVEFWQTNGVTENSYSDLRLVIENGAFKCCKNLKEIRLFYYAQDGTDRWLILGPENVIPGNDIFGDLEITADDLLPDEEGANHEKVRIVVSPDRYADFLNDPNWSRYSGMLVSADYNPSTKPDIEVNGLTYYYSTSASGIMTTDQVVTQGLSWWNAPIIAVELLMLYESFASGPMQTIVHAGDLMHAESAVKSEIGTIISSMSGNMTKDALTQGMSKLAGRNLFNSSSLFKYLGGFFNNGSYTKPFQEMVEKGFISKAGQIITTEAIKQLTKEELVRMNQLLIKFLWEYSIDLGLDIAKQEAITKSTLVYLQGLIPQVADHYTKLLSISGSVGRAGMGGYQTLWGELNQAQYVQGMKDNIISNMHQVGFVGGQLITTPSKELIYHTSLKQFADGYSAADICINPAKNTRLVAIEKNAFRGNTNLWWVTFRENSSVESDETTEMLITIPDSAFAGCTTMREFDLRLYTANGDKRALGPENFILCGNDIFAGCDSTQLSILVPVERWQDFLDNPSWAQYRRFFKKADVTISPAYTEFGVNYAYNYEGGNKKEQQLAGRTIEHLIALGPDDEYIKDNNGALGFFNDIGSWNNYKLDYALKNSFRGNENIKSVSFWDLTGWLFTGEAYTDLAMKLNDSCFADCPNLEYVDLLYLRTDGINEADPLTPDMVQLGDGVFENSPKVRFRMTDRQVELFTADTVWVKYKERFLPSLFMPHDPEVVSALSDIKYRNDVARPWYDNNASKWGDWLDLSLVKEFSYLNGKFSGNSDLRSFPDFKRFELIGLDYVGGSWFLNCSNLSGIELPQTIKTIGGWAFYGCSSLKEITIPASVEKIDDSAFQYSGLKTVRFEGTQPAVLGSNVFDLTSYSGFSIYVPAQAVDAYKTAWPSLAQYIRSDTENSKLTLVEVDKPGRLAELLGLTMIMEDNSLRYVEGPYWKYDSLTVRGHLNGLDIGVLRYMMGSDAWDSDPTDGRLRYLDMHYAHIDKDTENSYNMWGVNEYLEKENWIGEYMFHNCKAIETLILPETVTEIGENAFEEATNLRRLFIGEKLERYTRDLIEDNKVGIEELVFLTDNHATSESADPWEGPIGTVYTKYSQLGEYMTDPVLTSRSKNITALFEDDEVMIALAARRFYFPSEYLKLETTRNPRGNYQDGDGYIFYRNRDIKYFDEFKLFANIRELDYDFENCKALERITLPNSLEHIGYNAFRGCEKLAAITIGADSVPVLDRDALRDLPADFQIIVPKTHVKRYREKWEQYADHIMPENDDVRSDILEITLTEPNTLAEKLGFKTTTKLVATYEAPDHDMPLYGITSITGDYSNIHAIKVNGPIGGADFTVLRYLAGYDLMTDLKNTTPFGGCRNYLGHLEYIDLYDADIEPTNYLTDAAQWQLAIKFLTDFEDDVLPGFAFGKCYSLKTLILPRTMKKVKERAFQECESLESVVIGDDCEELVWSAFDDCASMTRMYILSRKKLEMQNESWIWRNMCNNYSPTFDAFYVRPSLYDEYVADAAYTGSEHRTNNISYGPFEDDESFAAFAVHAAASVDELQEISDITGWFRHHDGLRQLDALQYTKIDSLHASEMSQLTNLQSITLPSTIKSVDKDAFKNAAELRYLDMSQSAEYASVLAADGGVRSLGISENTIAYMPAEYGETADVNVAVNSATGFKAQNFRLVDGKNYTVPFAVNAQNVENTRVLVKSDVPYTVCLPYSLDIPQGAKVYRLSGRGSTELIFAQHLGRMEAMQPYLIWTEENDALLSTVNATLPSSDEPTSVGQQQITVGYTMRGTLKTISNAEAVELGAYVLNDDAKWHPVLSDSEAHSAVTIPAFRCFLLQRRNNTRAAVGMILEDATGIEQLRTIDADGTERVYDLSGRRIDANTEGIVIKNGKKVLNK